MAQPSNNLRERLLASLPQPENVTKYREETATLLAKHATALRWDKITANTFFCLAVLLLCWSTRPGRLGASGVHAFELGSALFAFMGAFSLIRYGIYASQIATLKEIKQVQLQILELQAAFDRPRSDA